MTDAGKKEGLDLILDLIGLDKVSPSSKIGKMLREGGPSKTREFRRIHNLPRRRWEEAEDLDELVSLLSAHLKTPAGEMELWPVQAAAIRDAFEQRGLFAPVAVGKGKALISLLVAELLKAERPLLLVPAQLREQTKLYVIPDMQRHWKLEANLTILAYSELSLAKNAKILEELRPDLIISDECFAPETQIAVPGGKAKKIEDLRAGDSVVAVRTNGPAIERVEAVWASATNHIIEIMLDSVPHRVIRTTENHPFYTSNGWMKAGALNVGSSVVCVVQRPAGENEGESVLLSELLSQVEDEPARDQSEDSHEGSGEKDIEEAQTSIRKREAGSPSDCFVEENERSEPYGQRSNKGQGIEYAPKDRAPTEGSRGKRKADSEAVRETGGSVGVGDRISDPNREKEGVGVPKLLQGGHSESHNHGGGRSGRGFPQGIEAARARPEKGSLVVSVGLARVTSIERRSVEPDGKGGRVHNLQISGPGNFVLAESGAVVHNCHRFKNKNAGRTRRMIRYMTTNPETLFVALSGTVTTRSIRDYGHVLRWCLKNRTPLPETWRELTQWADVLDVSVENRSQPGALAVWSPTDEPELSDIRQGFRDRLTETPGVIATKATELGVSLQILARRPDMPASCFELLHKLTETWETPDGDYITEAIDLWRHVREVCCGFWYKWQPPPPSKWFEARKEWKRYVRETLKHNRRKLDTELQVWNETADAHGQPRRPAILEPDEEATQAEIEELDAEYNRRESEWRAAMTEWQRSIKADHCFWCDWFLIRGTFEPNKVPEWVDDFAIRDATEWLNAESSNGIVWTEHIAFGERLAVASGFPYFGAGSKANIGIAEHRGPCIASIRAHSEGKNLQHHNRGLIVIPPSSGKTWEQLLGRKHREGQKADVVTFEVNLQAGELLASFQRAMGDARYLEHTLGSRQKLLYADRNFEVPL